MNLLRWFGLAIWLLLSGEAALAIPFDETTTPLRIGDVLTVNLPGEAALNKDFPIDRNGRVSLPEVGSLSLGGLPLPEASKAIHDRLSKAFRDLDRLSVSLKERRLLVSVLGYVKTPGPVEMPGDATVQQAITLAGGLAQGAQLDKLQVRHQDGSAVVFDYKKYLDSGDPKDSVELQPLDVIFVPASPLTGKVQIDFDGRTLAAAGDGGEDRASVKVFGEVNTPGTFAYKPGVSVVDVLMRAGGVTRYASVEQIRVIANGKPVIFNMQTYLDTGDKKALVMLEPGSTVFVPIQVAEVRSGASTVYVMGEVAKPGAMEAKPGASFVDILANAGGPTRFANTTMLRILRVNGTIDIFNLAKFTESAGGKFPDIHPGDAIFVPEKIETTEPSWLRIPPARAVQVIGALNRPGRYEWSNEMTLFDLIAQAGGPSAHADVANIQILVSENDKGTPTKFNLEQFLKGGGKMSSVPKIKAGYVVMVPELPVDPNDNKSLWVRQEKEHSIYIMGQVGIPGRYGFNPGLGFLDIVTAANGPTATADLRNIRVSHRGEKGSRVENVNLARYFDTGDERLLPKVRPGDVIYVPDKNKDYLDQPVAKTVRVLGAVAKPARYQFNDDMSLLDLLAEAGGPNVEAMQDRILVVNMGLRPQARAFDLLDFAKTADISRLPDVRAGDLVYVPYQSQGDLRRITDTVNGIEPMVASMALLKALGIKF